MLWYSLEMPLLGLVKEEYFKRILGLTYFSIKIYDVGIHKTFLCKPLQMSILIVCFCGEIRKISTFWMKKVLSGAMTEER